MNLKQLIDEIKSSNNYKETGLYLVVKLEKCSAFLLSGDGLYFATPNTIEDYDSTSTKYLELRTGITINSVENSPSFSPGVYDILKYKGINNIEAMDRFCELCHAYVKAEKTISFTEFFYSLVEVFESEKEVSFTNLIGAFGELSFIKKVYQDYNKNISSNWHNATGPFDKYDFSFSGFNIEIKSTIKAEKTFMIKHNQIFNEKENHLLVVNLEMDNSGLTFNELCDFFLSRQEFSSDLNFVIKLQKEKAKISPEDAAAKRFTLKTIAAYLNKELETIKEIPDCINTITYKYDFMAAKEEDIKTLIGKIHNC